MGIWDEPATLKSGSHYKVESGVDSVSCSRQNPVSSEYTSLNFKNLWFCYLSGYKGALRVRISWGIWGYSVSSGYFNTFPSQYTWYKVTEQLSLKYVIPLAVKVYSWVTSNYLYLQHHCYWRSYYFEELGAQFMLYQKVWSNKSRT